MNRVSKLLVAAFSCTALVGAALASESEDASGEKSDAIRGLRVARITLAQAIEAAREKVTGGTVLAAELSVDEDDAVYEVSIVDAAGRLQKAEIDARTGKVEEVEQADRDEDNAQAEAATLKAKHSLLLAVDAAQGKVPGGRPFEATAEIEDDELVFAVEFLAGDDVVNVLVNPRSGKVTKVVVENAEEDEDEEADADDDDDCDDDDEADDEGDDEATTLSRIGEILETLKEIDDLKNAEIEVSVRGNKLHYQVHVKTADEVLVLEGKLRNADRDDGEDD